MWVLVEAVLTKTHNVCFEQVYEKYQNFYHSIVILEIDFLEFKKGKPLWKHNNSLLQDIEYINLINDKITEIKTQYALPVYNMENIKNTPDNEIKFLINDQLFLETLLIELRGKSISYSSYKKKQNEQMELVEQNLTGENVETIEMLREELQTIRKAKMQGYLIRSRAHIIEMMKNQLTI